MKNKEIRGKRGSLFWGISWSNQELAAHNFLEGGGGILLLIFCESFPHTFWEKSSPSEPRLGNEQSARRFSEQSFSEPLRSRTSTPLDHGCPRWHAFLPGFRWPDGSSWPCTSTQMTPRYPRERELPLWVVSGSWQTQGMKIHPPKFLRANLPKPTLWGPHPRFTESTLPSQIWIWELGL